MFKGIASFASLMRSAQQMGGRMQEMNQRLREERVTASVAAGMVEIEANGVGEVLRLKIDPKLLERGELEMLEDLIPAAVNEALAKAKQLHVDAMKDMTEGIDLPGLSQALEQFAGGGDRK